MATNKPTDTSARRGGALRTVQSGTPLGKVGGATLRKRRGRSYSLRSCMLWLGVCFTPEGSVWLCRAACRVVTFTGGSRSGDSGGRRKPGNGECARLGVQRQELDETGHGGTWASRRSTPEFAEPSPPPAQLRPQSPLARSLGAGPAVGTPGVWSRHCGRHLRFQDRSLSGQLCAHSPSFAPDCAVTTRVVNKGQS